MEGIVQELKNKIDIVDFIGSYIQLKKAGRNFRANCPFHNEKSPSFVVSPDRQIWHCFGACGEGGDCIKFLMKWENITFYEALKELATKAGISLKTVGFEDKEWQQKEKILKINTITAEFFQYILHSTNFGKEARDYLLARNFSDGIVKTFQLGYAPSSWDSLLKFLQKKGFPDEDIVQSGMVVKNGAAKMYDRFRGRLIFPIKDIRGNIIGFSGRILEKSEHEAKYINTPETPVYHKRESLFGINLAKEAIKKQGNVLLVEGEFDMISPYQHSIENVVAIKGAAVTKEQLKLLKRLTNKITFALDGDNAGAEAMKKAIPEAEQLEFDIYVLDWEGAKDPDEMVNTNLIEFKNQLKSPISVYDFIIKLAFKKHPADTAFNKKKIGEEVGPFISSIQNPIIQSHYVKKLSKLMEISEDSIQRLLKSYQDKNIKPIDFLPKTITQPKVNRDELLEKYILACLFQSEKTYIAADRISSILTPTDFSIIAYQKIFDEFLKYKNEHEQENVKKFCDMLVPELQSVCNDLFLYDIEDLEKFVSKSKNEKHNLERVALRIKKESLKKSIQKLMLEVTEGDTVKEQEISQKNVFLKEVEKKATLLYN